MIVSTNPKPPMSEFVSLMEKATSFLNNDARKRPEYYAGRSGSPLEDDVKAALEECAKGTPFENTIVKESAQKFPDIVAAKLYGVEVKSTKDNHWTSTGSSIMESTRISDVEKIYMTFGKLGGTPIEFISKPYEECLYGIAVTHMPRYLIDMQLKSGETIFDKIGVKYDELRKMDNPIAPVAEYYRSKLKPGESLWWTGNGADETVSATIRLWKEISRTDKKKYIIYGCVNFPEVFNGNYDNYALWLASQGIVDTHIRDQFSSGGKELMRLANGKERKFPGVYRRVKKNWELFRKVMSQENTSVFDGQATLDNHALEDRLVSWAKSVSKYYSHPSVALDALKTMFKDKDKKMFRDNDQVL